jgi:hypothetical protein
MNQNCGTMLANDINNVSVTCAVDSFTVGGTLTGLISGESLVLQLNGSLNQTRTTGGNSVFPALADGTTYTVEMGCG